MQGEVIVSRGEMLQEVMDRVVWICVRVWVSVVVRYCGVGLGGQLLVWLVLEPELEPEMELELAVELVVGEQDERHTDEALQLLWLDVDVDEHKRSYMVVRDEHVDALDEGPPDDMELVDPE